MPFKHSIPILIILLTAGAHHCGAQDSVWTLRRCVDYARTRNLTIQQGTLNQRVAHMQYQQSKLSMLPSIFLSSNYGKSFGRSINPVTNDFVSTTYDFTAISGSAGVLLFGWFQKRNTIANNGLLDQIAGKELDQLKDDISLNITTGYLRILLAREQVRIGTGQLELSRRQLLQTEHLLRAGRSNGLDLAQVKTQLASDSAAFFKFVLEQQQAVIDMKAILNLDFTEPFAADEKVQPQISFETLSIDPEVVYNTALLNAAGIKASELKVKSAQKMLAVAKSGLYPTLNLNASSGTNYSSTYFEYTPGEQARLMPLGKQLRNNFSQSVFVGLSIPVFNALSTRLEVRKAKIAYNASVLASEQSRLDLRQKVYKACYDARASLLAWKAALSAAETANTGLQFAQKRYEKGLIPAIDLLTAQNTAFKADIAAASLKYDLFFKLMLIDYYTGENLFR